MDAAENFKSNGKIHPNAIAFDIDGVIADTMGLFVEMARKEYRVEHIRYEDITCYMLNECLEGIDDWIINEIVDRIIEGDYTLPLRPIAGAPGVLSRLGRNAHRVLLVTARPHMGPLSSWLAEHLQSAEENIRTVATGTYLAKADVLLENGVRHFVEDRLETCFALESVGIEPVLFRQPWNREPHTFREVGTWKELEALMDFPS